MKLVWSILWCQKIRKSLKKKEKKIHQTGSELTLKELQVAKVGTTWPAE
jgi:hypothetical protein